MKLFYVYKTPASASLLLPPALRRGPSPAPLSLLPRFGSSCPDSARAVRPLLGTGWDLPRLQREPWEGPGSHFCYDGSLRPTALISVNKTQANLSQLILWRRRIFVAAGKAPAGACFSPEGLGRRSSPRRHRPAVFLLRRCAVA